MVTVALNIGGGVTDWDGAQAAGLHVCLHVTSNSLNVWSSERGGVIVDDLVGGVEEEGVVVLGKCVNGSEDTLEIDGVVGHGDRGVVLAVEGVVWGVDVQSKVDAGISQSLHARIVVCRVIHGVDTNGVDSKLLELGNITRASSRISNGVLEGGGATWWIVSGGLKIATG